MRTWHPLACCRSVLLYEMFICFASKLTFSGQHSARKNNTSYITLRTLLRYMVYMKYSIQFPWLPKFRMFCIVLNLRATVFVLSHKLVQYGNCDALGVSGALHQWDSCRFQTLFQTLCWHYEVLYSLFKINTQCKIFGLI